MDDSKRYNGWKNYETWAVNLWIDNTESSQRIAENAGRLCTKIAPDDENVASGIWTIEQAAKFRLADALKEWIEETMIPDLGATLAADLLNAALSEVDWHEVAEHYLEGVVA